MLVLTPSNKRGLGAALQSPKLKEEATRTLRPSAELKSDASCYILHGCPDRIVQMTAEGET